MSVYRDRSSHCVIVIRDTHDHVEFVMMEEQNGEIRVDTHKMEGRKFHHTYTELSDYPVARAVRQFLNPLTPAIVVTERAKTKLTKMLGESTMSEAAQSNDKASSKKAKGNVKSAVVNDESDRSERNIVQTEKASVRTNGKVHAAPKPAPVKVEGDVKAATTKAKKGTWDVKETPTESNQAALKNAKKNLEEKRAKEAKQAAKAAKKSKKQTTNDADDGEESNVQTQTHNDTAHKTARKAAPAKPAKAAKKAAGKAAKPAQKAAPAKPAKAAQKTVKGTGKGAQKAAGKAAPAKAAKGNGAKRGRSGAYDEGQKITVLAKENPKRAGSAAYKIFELLKKSKTVGDFYAKGGASHNLKWNEDREYIKVH